jgi:hypothetical protein
MVEAGEANENDDYINHLSLGVVIKLVAAIPVLSCSALLFWPGSAAFARYLAVSESTRPHLQGFTGTLTWGAVLRRARRVRGMNYSGSRRN